MSRQIENLGRTLRPPWPGVAFAHVALAGRSNVGKSSLLNRLLGRRKLAGVGKTPGKTRSLQFFLVDGRFVLVDLPGYGWARVSRSLRQRWDSSIEDYLRSTPELAGVLVLVDGRLEEPSPLDLQLVEWLEARSIPWLPVFTKADKVGRGKRGAIEAAWCRASGAPRAALLWTSASTGEGIEGLWERIDEQVAARELEASPAPPVE